MKLPERDEVKSKDLEDLDELEDLDADEPDERRADMRGGEKKPPLTAILLGVIVVLLICIGALLLMLTNRQKSATDSTEALQQDIEDYANAQKQNDKAVQPSAQEAIIVEPDTSLETSEEESGHETEAEEILVESDTLNKTAIVVDVEDENDVSYTKEFILNEMLPYFADNNLDAVWDLAHLKRYVKLSTELKGTDSYYYMGDVNANGAPHGKGLAIYENNAYYYGSWENGVRSGDGRWYRFYIDEIGKPTTKKVYQAHSYSGAWSNDLPNGEGAEHYDVDISQLEVRERVIQNVVGNFSDGLYDGDMYANTVDYTGNVEEWNAVAQKGVFDLWRDMSSIGECSVWQHRDNPDSYMDIDKSENKNQGMRELLRITVTNKAADKTKKK
ncbi:MAG: hypothetical protein NC231_10565 [Bacillus sp. (in: Bacteria)]|nr:hypothetical protein [Bacillus sp. (in: firmicutes)]MCM1426799.1 hypothetical protein [Eubacterium sp.]